MNIARAAAAVSVTSAALGLGLVPVMAAPAGAATAGATAAATTAAASAKATSPVVINTCGTGSAPVRRPHQFGLSCDGSDFLVQLRWASWTAKGASGHGAEALNDCVPDCARGKFRDYPVRVSFWGTTAVKGHPGERRYTHYTLTYTRTTPPGLGHKRTGTL